MGHLIRRINPFATDVIEGKINGREGRRRPRNAFVGEPIEMSAGCNAYSHT